MSSPRRILVLCTANRCRSQMAEGWLRHFGAGRLEVFSAGTDPGGVHPLAVAVMAESGIDISAHRSEDVSIYVDQPFDAVVTVCDSARSRCPVFPAARRTVHESFDDPDDTSLVGDEVVAKFRRTRDAIAAWSQAFVNELRRDRATTVSDVRRGRELPAGNS